MIQLKFTQLSNNIKLYKKVQNYKISYLFLIHLFQCYPFKENCSFLKRFQSN